MISLQFLITALIITLIPGTGVVYTMNTGLTQKSRASIFAAIGCTLGILPHLAASFLGLSAIMHLSAKVFLVIKYAGCLYLLYLAVKHGNTQVRHSFLLVKAKKIFSALYGRAFL